MKKHSKIFVALLAVAVLISALTIALVACNTNKDDGGNAGRIGESGYYEGKVTANELLTYGKAMFGSESAEGNSKSMSITYASEHDELGPIWMIYFDVYGDEMDDEAIIYVTDSNEDAKQLYQLENDEASDWDDEFVINKVVGNRVIKETKQDLIKNNLLVGLQMDNISDKFVNVMKSSFNEVMDNLSNVDNSNVEEAGISIEFHDEYESDAELEKLMTFGCAIPTSPVGNCWTSYYIITPNLEDGFEEEKRLLDAKYTSDSYIEDEEDYLLFRLEPKPGLVFDDILDENDDPTGEAAVIDYYYNSEEGKHVVIPSTAPNGKPVTHIGSNELYVSVFDDDIETVTIPTSVKTIGKWAFGDLERINYLGDLKEWCALDNESSIGNAKLYVKQNGEDVEIKGDIIIPEGTTKIGKYVLAGLDITSVTIPDSVQGIGEGAFYGCEEMRTVTIGKGVQSIGAYAFSGCTGLQTVYYEGTREQWNDIAISNMYDDNHAFIYFVTRYYFSEQDPYANHTAKEGEQYWHWDEETHTPEVWVKQD